MKVSEQILYILKSVDVNQIWGVNTFTAALLND